MSKRRDNPISRTAWVVGGAVATAAAVVGGLVLMHKAQSASSPSPTPSPTPPSGRAYDSTTAIPVLLVPGGTPNVGPTVPVGSSIQANPPLGISAFWQTPGVVTSDATVLTPSDPATTNGFVAVKAGTATLSGSYLDPNTQQPVNVSAYVTVV